MSFTKKLSYGAAAAALFAVAAPAAVYAQSTTSQLRGSVVDESGSPISGATVTVIHVPTATVSTSVTGSAGSFTVSNLRVGGPYRVAIQASGYEAGVLEGINLDPGASSPLRVSLNSGAQDVVVVRGQRIENIALDNGVGSAFSAADLASNPSLNRDFTDILARDPLVNSAGNGQLSIAGMSTRLNALSLDGVEIGEQFGINSDGIFPSQRPPVDLDAVESVSVTIADFSVLNNGFQGGSINVVTRSGTNEFDGNIGYYLRDGDFTGDRAFDRDIDLGAFEENEVSINVGGPIIEDTLFFFVSWSDYEISSPANFDRQGVSDGLFDLIRTISQNTYNYDPGQAASASNLSETDRFLIKLDWNINDNHRASVTRLDLEELQPASLGLYDFPTAARSETVTTDQLSFELASNWTDNFSTFIRIGQRETQQRRTPNGQPGGPAGSNFASFSITNLDENDPYFTNNAINGAALLGGNLINVFLGPDRFDQANAIDDELFTFFFQGDYSFDNHNITGGFQLEDYSVVNVFVPGSSGVVEFDTLEDFANGLADTYFIDLPSSGNIADGLTNYEYNLWSFFLEDTWSITPDFELNFGLRYERISQDDAAPARLDTILRDGSRATFQEAYGISGRDNLDGVDILLPRVGFNWAATDRLTLRGGFGLFSGGSPAVFLANSFVPLTFRGSAGGTTDDGIFVNVDGRAIPADALTDLQNNANAAVLNGSAAFGVFDSNFEIPAQWRTAIIAEYNLDMNRWGLNLGDDYRVTAQYIHSAAHNALTFRNLGWERADLQQFIGTTPSGLTIYPNMDRLGESAPILLTNTDEGGSDIFSLAVAKDYENGFSFDVSYAWADVEDAGPLSSSRAISNFRGNRGPDRNNAIAQTSNTEVEHSFNIFLNYERDFFGDLTSSFSLFGTIQSGLPYNYGMRSFNHLFGVASDGEFPYGNNDQLYVPILNAAGTGFNDPIVQFANAGVEADLLEFILARGLQQYAGGHVPINSDNAPWTQRWDFGFEQELPGIGYFEQWVGDNNFKFTMDIFNVLNLLNDDWGQQVSGPAFGGVNVARVDLIDTATGSTIRGSATDPVCGVSATCVYEFQRMETSADGSRLTSQNRNQSVWQIRFGFRYDF